MSNDEFWLVRVDYQSPVYVYPTSDNASAFAKHNQLLYQYGSSSISLGPWPRNDTIARDEEPPEDGTIARDEEPPEDGTIARDEEPPEDDNFDAIGIVIGVIGSAMFWFTLILLGKASAEGWFNA